MGGSGSSGVWPGNGDGSLSGNAIDVRRLNFPDTLDSPALARQLVGNMLAGCDPAKVADAQLIASELVTNAVQYGGGGTLIARNSGARFRIEVSDLNPEPLVAGDPGPASPSGRGLLIVASVARAWGVRPGYGKTVWAEITLSGSPA